MPIEGPMHSIETTDGCWNCECEEGYVHAKIRETKCEKCGASCCHQPDSYAADALNTPSLRMTGSEYVENVGLCPFCHSNQVEGGTDISFAGDTMISSCSCGSCGSTWRENYALDGWIEEGGDKADSWHPDTRHDDKTKGLEQERARLRDLLQALVSAADAEVTHGQYMLRELIKDAKSELEGV